MKFIAVDEQKNLYFDDIEIPQIKANECLIKVKAIGVNRADILQKQGKYPAPVGESTILGLEISGEIVQCGEQVTTWCIDDKIFALVVGGAYAQYVAINVEHLMRLPDTFSFVQGAATAETFLTAYQSLFTLAELKPYQSVLVHAGASGVGSAAIQLAKACHCYVVTTVGSPEKVQACYDLGVDEVINYREIDFVDWSKSHQPKGFDVIVDVVAGEYLNKNIKVAALDGKIIILSMLAGRFSEAVDIAKLLIKRLTITASTLRNRSDHYKTQLINDFVHDFYEQLVDGGITPLIDKCFAWHHVENAHQRMQHNENIGKIILTLD